MINISDNKAFPLFCCIKASEPGLHAQLTAHLTGDQSHTHILDLLLLSLDPVASPKVCSADPITDPIKRDALDF